MPTHFAIAIEQRGAVGAPLIRHELPVTKAIAVFQPATAIGKLKAVIIPTTPSGFQFSINMCPGPKDENRDTFLYLDKGVYKSLP